MGGVPDLQFTYAAVGPVNPFFLKYGYLWGEDFEISHIIVQVYNNIYKDGIILLLQVRTLMLSFFSNKKSITRFHPGSLIN